MRYVGLFLLAGLLSLVLAGLGAWQPLQAQVSVVNQASASFGDGSSSNRTTSNQTSFQTAGSAVLRIIKTSDRQAAEPGDVVVYQLLVENTGTVEAQNVVITDQLPLGMTYVQNSLQASPLAPVSVNASGRVVEASFATLPPRTPLTIAYAVLLTPDSVRGSGRNVAQVSATGLTTVSAAYQLAIRPGIIADCGTILGRIFVDKNFDGEQQPGEPGVPNAVVFLDNGNRIVADPEGLFSVKNALPGNRVGTLDLSSLPGYTLAPNLYRISDNSQSRLVRLSPGGLARMNFAVTPTFGEGQP